MTPVQDFGDGIPQRHVLYQNYPNPFNPTTVISFQSPVANHIRIMVYDLLGREVAVLMDEKKEPGRYEVRFDGKNLASGVYLYRMQAGQYVETRKLLLIR
jgi:5-hydroxyisourate hydrolase-like protein (transthyretin family)